jgi:hypothetical protein
MSSIYLLCSPRFLDPRNSETFNGFTLTLIAKREPNAVESGWELSSTINPMDTPFSRTSIVKVKGENVLPGFFLTQLLPS